MYYRSGPAVIPRELAMQDQNGCAEDPVRALPPLSRDEFARRGFVVLRAPIISRDYCDLLNARLE